MVTRSVWKCGPVNTPIGIEPVNPLALLIVHSAATLFMCGLIWFVQIVHYPLFGLVGSDRFVEYERQHARRTTLIVGPMMLVELMTAAAIVIVTPRDVPRWLAIAGVALVGTIWISTASLQVPQHRRLAGGFDGLALRRLVGTNWIRTVAWTLRGVIAVTMIGLVVSGEGE